MAMRPCSKSAGDKAWACSNPARLGLLLALCSVLAACATTPDYNRSYLQAARYQNAGYYARAEEFHRAALQQMQSAPGGMPNAYLALQMSNLASALYLQDESDPEFLSLMEEALRLANLELQPDADLVQAIVSNHSLAMVWNDRLEEAEADCQRLEALDSSVLARPNAYKSTVLVCHAMTSVLKKDFAAADAAFLQSKLALRQSEHYILIQTIWDRSERRYLKLKAKHQANQASSTP